MANETSVGGTRTARVQSPAETTSATSAMKPQNETNAEKGKSAASEAKVIVKDQALGLKDKALSSVRSAASDGKFKAVQKVGGVSRALEASAAKLDEDVGKTYGDFARTAAKTIDELAAKLDGKELDELLGEAKGFIRKSPAIAIGIAAALGFAASRVVKSGLDLDDDI